MHRAWEKLAKAQKEFTMAADFYLVTASHASDDPPKKP